MKFCKSGKPPFQNAHFLIEQTMLKSLSTLQFYAFHVYVLQSVSAFFLLFFAGAMKSIMPFKFTFPNWNFKEGKIQRERMSEKERIRRNVQEHAINEPKTMIK